jgi:Ca2+/Na+ antiporter
MLLPILLLACLTYLGFAIYEILKTKKRPEKADTIHPGMKFFLGGGIPVAVTATMTYLFLIAGGATTVQFNAGSSSRMNAWSTWVDLWPLFLFLTAATGLGTLVWTIASAVKKECRVALPAAIASLLLSILAFFTVASYFPSA